MSGISNGRRRRVVVAASWVLVCMLPVPSPAQSQGDLSGLLRLVRRLHADGDYAGALRELRAGQQRDPGSYDVRCWTAEILMDSAELLSRSGTRAPAMSLAEEALRHARAAVGSRRRGAEGWFQVGRATGTISQLSGGPESVQMARESKSAFETAISLDSSHASALHGLARWHRAVASVSAIERAAASLFFGGLPPASREDAVQLFRRAAALEPDASEHHLELAKTYLELDRNDLARAELEIVVGLLEARRGDAARKEEARRLLGSMAAGRRP